MLRQERHGTSIIKKSRPKVQGRNRLINTFSGRNPGTATNHRHPQETLVMHRALQDQAVITQPIAMVRDVDDDRIVAQPGLFQRDQNAADIVIHQRDLAISVRDDLAQLLIRLRHDAAVVLSDFSARAISGRFLGQNGLVPPRSPFEGARPIRWQIDLGRIVQARPRFGRIKRVMRIGKADPCAKRLVAAPVFQPFDRAVRCPCRVVPGDGQLRMPRLGRVLGIAGVLSIERVFLIAFPIGIEPALVMLTVRRLFRQEPIVTHQHHLDVTKAHVRAIPIIAVIHRRPQTFGRPGGLIRVIGGKVRLSEKRGFIA